jgi:four helix bundle protein
VKDFKNLKIWQNGMEITDLLYDLSVNMPNTEKFGLTSQMTRAAVSIPSNIAEVVVGEAKKTILDFVK